MKLPVTRGSDSSAFLRQGRDYFGLTRQMEVGYVERPASRAQFRPLRLCHALERLISRLRFRVSLRFSASLIFSSRSLVCASACSLDALTVASLRRILASVTCRVFLLLTICERATSRCCSAFSSLAFSSALSGNMRPYAACFQKVPFPYNIRF